MAYHTFAHVLDLDISFHLERRTGALSRVRQAGGPLPLLVTSKHQHCQPFKHLCTFKHNL